jgi:hypothetical protein
MSRSGALNLLLREAFATRQSDPKHVRWQIAASQTLLAMTMNRASCLPVTVKAPQSALTSPNHLLIQCVDAPPETCRLVMVRLDRAETITSIRHGPPDAQPSRCLRSNVAGSTIGMPRNGSRASKSASPETITSACPRTASSRNLSSSGSRRKSLRADSWRRDALVSKALPARPSLLD